MWHVDLGISCEVKATCGRLSGAPESSPCTLKSELAPFIAGAVTVYMVQCICNRTILTTWNDL
jgi:hypothetical protein